MYDDDEFMTQCTTTPFLVCHVLTRSSRMENLTPVFLSLLYAKLALLFLNGLPLSFGIRNYKPFVIINNK